jgi:hypothetical protein
VALYDRQRFTFVAATMGLSLAGSAVSAAIAGGWISATVLNVAIDALILWYIVTRKDGVLGRLALMGIAGGLIELCFADPWAVGSGTLVYERGGPFIIDSPLYMPLGWTYVLLQIGYISWWVWQQKGLAASIAVAAVLGGTNIPVYEMLARAARWWYYQDVPMVLGAPYYVILGEALIGLALPFIVRPIERMHPIWSLGLGVVLGLWTWASAVIAFRLAG